MMQLGEEAYKGRQARVPYHLGVPLLHPGGNICKGHPQRCSLLVQVIQLQEWRGRDG